MFFAAILNYEIVNASTNDRVAVAISLNTPLPNTVKFENGMDTDGLLVTSTDFSDSQYLYIERVLQLTANSSSLPNVTNIQIMITAINPFTSESYQSEVNAVIYVTGNQSNCNACSQFLY